MNPFSRLQDLARRASGDPDAALDQVLALACELLRTDVALLGTVDGERRTRLPTGDSRQDAPLPV